MNYEYELMHYGVKGMKWGVRKKRDPVQTSDLRRKYDDTKAAKKTADKEYNKAFNKAYRYSQYHPISQYVGKKQKAESDRRWEDAANKAKTYVTAKNAYKDAKKERKQAIKDTHAEINKKTGLGEKLVYNDATRKLAAKYVVDNNMSMADATKKANNVAKRNTAIFMAAYGTIAVATLVASK